MLPVALIFLFQFTPLREGRHLNGYVVFVVLRHFNSRPCERGDTPAVSMSSPACLFQFTPLREGRQQKYTILLHFLPKIPKYMESFIILVSFPRHDRKFSLCFSYTSHLLSRVSSGKSCMAHIRATSKQHTLSSLNKRCFPHGIYLVLIRTAQAIEPNRVYLVIDNFCHLIL